MSSDSHFADRQSFLFLAIMLIFKEEKENQISDE